MKHSTSDSSAPSASTPRRAFIKSLSAAGIGALAAPLVSGSTQAEMAKQKTAPRRTASASGKRRYIIVGTGIRHTMFRDAILGQYAEHTELVGLCDSNPGRLALSARQVKEHFGQDIPTAAPEAFEQLIREQQADAVLVMTTDSTHDDYMVRAMDAGCDVITEKPMTTTAAKCQRILDAQKRSGKDVRVTFNYRYSPPRTQIKDLLMKGAIGEVLSVDFNWLLNTHHGADYFRRWHGEKRYSGGLMVHKATHHFDLVNWWLGAAPVKVTGSGKREFYTPAMAKRMGLKSHHDRCHTCPEARQCGFYFSLADHPGLKALYLDQEKHDGYFRDQCVFGPRIDIEDTMHVIVDYDSGASLCYSLNAFNSWEGYTIAFNGTQGRIEHSIVEQVYVSGTETVQGGIVEGGVQTRLIPLRGEPQEIEPWKGTGSHGGGDTLLLDDLFLPHPPEDRWLRASDHRAGAASILVGVAANRCFETGHPIRINDLVEGFEPPQATPMPTRQDPVPMPPHRERI